MNLNERHALAMARNYRTAHPTANRHDVADYVAECMVKFTGAENAHRLDTTVAQWYDFIINHKG